MVRVLPFLCALVFVLCFSYGSAERVRQKRAFKTLAQIGDSIIQILKRGALKLHDNPPDDVSFVKLGGNAAMEKDNRAIRGAVQSFEVNGRLVYGKVAGDLLIQKFPSKNGFPPRLLVYRIKESYEGVVFKDPIQFKYLNGRGYSLKKFLGDE